MTIGRGCVIGNSTELKNCVLLDKVQVPRYNCIGDSVLGNGAHPGADSICSIPKANGSDVVIRTDGFSCETHLRKLGAIVADGADIGCSCVASPGTIIGKNISVYPLTPLRGVVGANMIVKNATKIVERR